MRTLLASLVRGRSPEIGVALALGYAAARLAESLASIATHLLAQHVGRDPFAEEDFERFIDLFTAPGYLNFRIGDTLIFYGPLVSAAIALGLVVMGAAIVVRRRDRVLGGCPYCASLIPYESTHCAYCGSAIAPGAP